MSTESTRLAPSASVEARTALNNAPTPAPSEMAFPIPAVTNSTRTAGPSMEKPIRAASAIFVVSVAEPATEAKTDSATKAISD